VKTFAQLGIEIGELVQSKNAAYGSSFAKAGKFLALLYPAGLQPEQYNNALLLVRIFDKQMRIATDADAFGETPYADIAGYGILGAHMHQQQKEGTQEWLDSVNGPDAKLPSEDGLTDFAVTTTSAKTTTSVSAPPEPKLSKQHSNCCIQPTSVPAETATEAASQRADARRKSLNHNYKSWLQRHNTLHCIACEKTSDSYLFVHLKTKLGCIRLRVCSPECLLFCVEKLMRDEVEGASL
jgi:hypothetical protein